MTDALLEELGKGGASLLVAKDRQVAAYHGRGVSDLYRLLTTQPERLLGADVADKAVGAAAAALMILGGVRSVQTFLASEPALRLFSDAALPVHYVRREPVILNRRGDGPCPLEARCKDLHTPAECLEEISAFLSS
ncbi:MAG: DUF1893 domain-containing protein [Bacteroidaceae bacterium]|nr:DUF1893 domain-containing protein [Bacteroidaceae bacterium]